MLLQFLLLWLPFSFGIPLNGPRPQRLARTSRYASLTELKQRDHRAPPSGPSYSSVVRSSLSGLQHVMEVKFNGIPRYLLLDTGSADTWMISPDFQCLHANLSAAPLATCQFGDPYTGPPIPQTANDTFYQVYGTGEIEFGTFGKACVSVAGFTIENQTVALVDRGFEVGDGFRSGVIGLAPRAVTSLYENINASTTPPNGTNTLYQTVFESMYSPTVPGEEALPPLFSLALQRGGGGGYIAFGGLPPVDFSHDFVFTSFEPFNYFGEKDPTRYYPIQLQGVELNGKRQGSAFTTIIDSGTPANRLPTAMADQINAAYNPPAVFNEELQLYITHCNATAPPVSFAIGNTTFVMDPRDMFLSYSAPGGLCATSITQGYDSKSQAFPDGFYALGDAFLNSVVAVFDVGEGGMWFAPHNY